MSAQPRFWPASRAAGRRRVSRRGFFAVAGVHLAALAGVALLSAGPAKTTVAAGRKASATGGESPAAPADEEAVVWVDPAAFEAPPAPALPPAPVLEPPPTSEPPASAPPRPLPVREPFLAATPRPKSNATPAVASRPRKVSAPRSPPTTRAQARSVPVGRPRPRPVVVAGAGTNAAETAGTNDTEGPTGANGTDWYASMLHERFHARWEQPTSVFATTQRYVATLRLRIERDGRISDFRLVRSSGLVPMDESVLAAAARVGRVDPPPAGLLRGGAYVVNVGFVRE